MHRQYNGSEYGRTLSVRLQGTVALLLVSWHDDGASMYYAHCNAVCLRRPLELVSTVLLVEAGRDSVHDVS